MATQEYAIELGIYSQYADIPPTVVLTTAVGDEQHGLADLHDIIIDLRSMAEEKLGDQVEDESVFIRVFKR